jgi:adenosylhomocysteine nucleosidase
MDSEAVHLRRRLADAREDAIGPCRRTRGRIGATAVDLVVSGIGLINAAAATSALCAVDPPATLLNYGCAGAHRDDLGPGDVVLGDRVVHVSSQVILPSGERKPMGVVYHVGETRTQTEAIAADHALLDRARAAAGQVTLPRWPGSAEPARVFVGAVASADIWTQHGESIRTLHDLHGSLCEEMEAAAVAQVAATYGIPFLAVKDISNNELRKPTTVIEPSGWPSLEDISDQLGLRAALVVEALIGGMLGAVGGRR